MSRRRTKVDDASSRSLQAQGKVVRWSATASMNAARRPTSGLAMGIPARTPPSGGDLTLVRGDLLVAADAVLAGNDQGATWLNSPGACAGRTTAVMTTQPMLAGADDRASVFDVVNSSLRLGLRPLPQWTEVRRERDGAVSTARCSASPQR